MGLCVSYFWWGGESVALCWVVEKDYLIENNFIFGFVGLVFSFRYIVIVKECEIEYNM